MDNNESEKAKEKIAIDVGGVIIEKKFRNGADTNFDINNIEWIPGALSAIERLSQRYDVYILSFCGRKTEAETRLALRKEVAKYIPEEKWIFTREREYKIDRMKTHGISLLVDDTLQIIDWVRKAGMKGIHFRSPACPDWASVKSLLL